MDPYILNLTTPIVENFGCPLNTEEENCHKTGLGCFRFRKSDGKKKRKNKISLRVTRRPRAMPCAIVSGSPPAGGPCEGCEHLLCGQSHVVLGGTRGSVPRDER